MMGVQNFWTHEGVSFHERRIRLPKKHRHSTTRMISMKKAHNPWRSQKKQKDWLIKHGWEGFLRVAEVPPHEEPEKVTSTIDLEEMSKGTMHTLVGLLDGGLCSIENPPQTS